ncbi:MAG: thioredoxin [Gammaproteobacteria bacterium]|nr:MAG: thioredoxin [Gammaproteobacteria bacterium]
MNVIEINLENAKQYLVDESFNRPVLIDFWADWCAPCKTLMPILEKLANEYAGAFLLAKVNADEMNMISSQFGVRSLPTVMLMKDGQPIDGFAGALPEKEVRELLDKYLPKLWEKLVTDAQTFIMAGDFNSALPLLRQAYDESKHDAAIAYLLVQCHLELNRIDNAEAILATVKAADQDAHYQQLLAEIELKKQAAKSPELVALEAAHAREPDNLQFAYDLAIQYHAELAHRPALELFIGILRKNRNFADGAVKKTFTDILTSLGKGDALAIEFQRKLFTLLY